MNKTSFKSHLRHGYLRLGFASPNVELANPKANAEEIYRLALIAVKKGVAVFTTPELSLSGYSLDDLVQQEILTKQSLKALTWLIRKSAKLPLVIIVGLPYCHGHKLLNLAVAIGNGKCFGAVAKRYLPNYQEYYEERVFSSGLNLNTVINIDENDVPLADKQIFKLDFFPQCKFAIDICEDAWVPVSPGINSCLAGANVILNPSASNVTINKAPLRRAIIKNFSYIGKCAYVYVAAGYGESTTDLAWDGQGMIYEMGEKLIEANRFAYNTENKLEVDVSVTDVDISHIQRERRLSNVFSRNADSIINTNNDFLVTNCKVEFKVNTDKLIYPLTKTPYVPEDTEEQDRICEEIYNIQIQGLSKRLKATGIQSIVLGLSGGIDSAHALLIADAVIDKLKLSKSSLKVFYLKASASTQKSFNRALSLCNALDIKLKEIDISNSVNQMIKNIDHPAKDKNVYDTTYENIQAGLRSDYLFRLANLHKALVLGTGDLSELALGWCTFGVGDHMAHYNINSSLTKTLIQYVMRWVAHKNKDNTDLMKSVKAILSSDITPELIPNKNQKSEEILGPYFINDFFLYHTLRNGFTPDKIVFLSNQVSLINTKNSIKEVIKRLSFFYSRFFSQQYKRSTVPNGPKTSYGGSLSPRGDWRAPADVASDLWKYSLEELKQELKV